MSDPAVHVYCGPTLSAADVRTILPAAVIHPPLRHGDLLRHDAQPGDTVIVIDGAFHHAAAARHKEFLELLSRGVCVVGAASMGALRAAELHPYGMIGVGEIFAGYRDGRTEADDEVAVSHEPGPGTFRPVSVALADIRAVIAAAVADSVLSSDEASQIISRAASLYYPRRTWRAIAGTGRDSDLTAALGFLEAWNAGYQAASAKRADALDALALAAAGKLHPAPAGSWTQEQWRTYLLRHWISRHRRLTGGDVHVPYLAVLQYQQLYDPDFPRRWREHVLSRMADATPAAGSGPSPASTAEVRALAAAEASGLAIRYLSASQLGYWLTPRELAALPGTEKLARILIRSIQHDPAAGFWPVSTEDAPGLLTAPAAAAAAAAAAVRRSGQLAGRVPGRSLYDLDPGKLRDHLAASWHLDPRGDQELTAAARDRGFYSAAAAADAARSFVLAASSPGGS